MVSSARFMAVLLRLPLRARRRVHHFETTCAATKKDHLAAVFLLQNQVARHRQKR